MRPRREEYDSQEFYDLWHSDTPLREIASQYGVTIRSVWAAAQRREFDPKLIARADG